jgi:post-segregation antitoxin (ccd killing protein)
MVLSGDARGKPFWLRPGDLRELDESRFSRPEQARSGSELASFEPRSVQSVCMARVNVYLPDDLAERARSAGLSISAITQEALRVALSASDTDRWLDHLEGLRSHDVSHESVIRALDAARDEFGSCSAGVDPRN